MTTKTTSSQTPTYYACGRSLYERGNDDRPAAECYTDADCVALASQSARIAALEGAYSQTVEALNHRNARCGELAAHTAELNARAGAAEYGRAKALARIAELEGALAAAAARLDEAGYDESAKDARSLLSTKEG